MTENEIINKTNKRPLGISIIAFLNILKGIIGLMVLLYLSTFDEQVGDKFDITIEYFDRFMYLVIGIGLSLGKRWAWWIFSLLLTFSIFYNIFSFIISNDILVKSGVSSDEITKYFYKLGASTIFQLILLVYVYQKIVFKFFNFEVSSLKRKLTIVIGINIILIIIVILNEVIG